MVNDNFVINKLVVNLFIFKYFAYANIYLLTQFIDQFLSKKVSIISLSLFNYYLTGLPKTYLYQTMILTPVEHEKAIPFSS
ncbi:MAG: hypothetical protein CMIDDMOC_00359 [Sodalis sp. Fle]|nr:MAG: hypothetical protein CMIDDMOC_00359 [Sodalis sp. Fle]